MKENPKILSDQETLLGQCIDRVTECVNCHPLGLTPTITAALHLKRLLKLDCRVIISDFHGAIAFDVYTKEGKFAGQMLFK